MRSCFGVSYLDHLLSWPKAVIQDKAHAVRSKSKQKMNRAWRSMNRRVKAHRSPCEKILKSLTVNTSCKSYRDKWKSSAEHGTKWHCQCYSFDCLKKLLIFFIPAVSRLSCCAFFSAFASAARSFAICFGSTCSMWCVRNKMVLLSTL